MKDNINKYPYPILRDLISLEWIEEVIKKESPLKIKPQISEEVKRQSASDITPAV